MTDFLNRPLGLVTRIFRFLNGEAPRSAIDLGSAAQPVYDYSRQSELGARGSQRDDAYLFLGQTDVHVATGDIFVSSDIYALFDSIGGLVDFNSLGARKDRLWYIMSFCTTNDTADLGNVNLGFRFDPDGDNRTLLVNRWDVFGNPLVSGGNTPMMLGQATLVTPVPTPLFLPPGTLMVGTSLSDASGTVTVRRHALFWAGPQGATPPGMS